MKDGYHIVLDRILPAGEAAEGKTACCVHLLVADVSEMMADEELLAQQTATLSPQRKAKATAISNLRNRALSVGVALLFDRLLQEVGLREQDMEYVEGEHGKPVINVEMLKSGNIEILKGGKLEFNLSHSGRMVAAAILQPSNFQNNSTFQHFNVSTFPPLHLGLDIQHITRYRPELVRRMFNDTDRALFAACTDETARQRLFAQLWCRAEAFAKATGEGLRWPFPTPPSNAHFTDFEVGEEYCGSVCVIIDNG